MPTVLVVEDSTTDRRVVGFLLKRAGGWEIEYATHGQEALEKVQRSAFDLMLTDLIMPAMDGLELVSAVRERCPRVPVILMTSRGNEGIAMLALRAGAVSYIPKRLLPRQLVDTVARVMTLVARPRAHAPESGAMREFKCSFVLKNDVGMIRSAIAYVQENVLLSGLCDEAECTRVGVALDEALVNALVHGNLEMGPTPGIESDKDYAAMFSHRSKVSPYADRRIHFAASVTPDQGVFTVCDEGLGFDPSGLPNPDDLSPLEKGCGRGVVLMRMFMTEVAFENNGRQVTLVKRRGTA
jgi:CheY-like chemotaxis protein/anti-sigma regulatory factor (Ser/Thr protein kinase)